MNQKVEVCPPEQETAKPKIDASFGLKWFCKIHNVAIETHRQPNKHRDETEHHDATKNVAAIIVAQIGCADDFAKRINQSANNCELNNKNKHKDWQPADSPNAIFEFGDLVCRDLLGQYWAFRQEGTIMLTLRW